ncbi:MAG: MFS transporter [Chloroflexi bacterium]|nr:MFS transporter [Chloroflexota bacterium]
MPETRERRTIFYGWWVVTGCVLIALYTSGIINYGFTAIFEPIAGEFNWSYTQISLGASLRGLETGLLAPLVGVAVDRWGPRKMIFAGCVITGAGLVVLSRIDSLGMFYVAFFLIAVGTSACTATVLLTAVAHWFRKKVGIASGIMSSGFALGGLLVPLVTTMVDNFGWRDSMLYLGLGVWVVTLPLSLLVRDKPEQYGYLPDGASPGAAENNNGETEVPEVDIPARQGLKTATFWHISLANMCQILVVNAVVVHVMPYLSSIGMSRSTAAFVATMVPLASIAGRIGFGWFADTVNKKKAGAIGYSFSGIGLLLFGLAGMGQTWALVPFLVFFGTGWGCAVTLRVSLLREYFGRKNFGAMHGFALGVTMVGNIIGPLMAGWAFDTWGSYQGTWFALASVAGVASVLVATIPPVTGRVKLGQKAGA